MIRFIFLFIFFININYCYSSGAYERYVSGDLNDVLKKLGVFDLRRKAKVGGEGVNIVVHDEFNKNDSTQISSHGDIVSNYIRKVAPEANLIPQSREDSMLLNLTMLRDLKVRIVNQSFGPQIPMSQHFKVDYKNEFQNYIEMAVQGLFIVITTGNQNILLGTDDYGKALTEVMHKINTDPSVPGAIIMVGSGLTDFRLAGLERQRVNELEQYNKDLQEEKAAYERTADQSKFSSQEDFQNYLEELFPSPVQIPVLSKVPEHPILTDYSNMAGVLKESFFFCANLKDYYSIRG